MPGKRKFRAASIKYGSFGDEAGNLNSSGGRNNAQSRLSPKKRPIEAPVPARNTRSNKKRMRTTTSGGLLDLPENMLVQIMGYFIAPGGLDMESFLSIQSVSKRLQHVANTTSTWHDIPDLLPDKSALNINAFEIIRQKCVGTEGACYYSIKRATKENIAIKRSRVFPENEGIPYYMIRDLAALRQLNHPNICSLLTVSLKAFQLHLLFPYYDRTLQDYLTSLPHRITKPVIRNLMSQLIAAVDHCHSRGILHRNLKPKHLLIQPGPNFSSPLEGCVLRLADFSLVRILTHPPKKLTPEVITLWYRPPELLMGLTYYTAAVDMWSVGCIFAELLEGRALFPGSSEIEQLFKIFSKVGLPAPDSWPEFTQLSHYQAGLFPAWPQEGQLRKHLALTTDEEYDLVIRFLTCNPAHRISAAQARVLPYFASDVTTPEDTVIQQIEQRYSHPDLLGLHSTTLRQYSYLRNLEHSRDVDAYVSLYGSAQSVNRVVSRSTAIEWSLNVLVAFEAYMSLRTVFFAIGLYDLFSSQRKLPLSSQEAHLLVPTCIHIASKCEDLSYIGVKDLAATAAYPYDPKDILIVEEVVMNSLEFRFYIPTIIDFVHLFCDCISEIKNMEHGLYFGKFLAEIALTQWEFLRYNPSLVGTAIACYTIMYNPTWTRKLGMVDSLMTLTGYSKEELVPCMQHLQQCHTNLRTTMNSIVYERYSLVETGSVAQWAPHSDIRV